MFSYTVKPVVYGSLAARREGVPMIASLIPGAGAAAQTPSTSLTARLLLTLVRRLYRLALTYNQTVFFQNPDDIAFFVQNEMVDAHKAVRIMGRGSTSMLFPPLRHRASRSHFY